MSEKRTRESRTRLGYIVNKADAWDWRRHAPKGLLESLTYKSFPHDHPGWMTLADAVKMFNEVHPAIYIDSTGVLKNWCKSRGVKCLVNGNKTLIHVEYVKTIIKEFMSGALILEIPDINQSAPPAIDVLPASIQSVEVPVQPSPEDEHALMLKMLFQISEDVRELKEEMRRSKNSIPKQQLLQLQ